MKKDTSHKSAKLAKEVEPKNKGNFSKVLARFYDRWYTDSIKSVAYCEEKGDIERAKYYRNEVIRWKKVIDENREAIDFFSQGDNAFTLDYYLPEKFRGYK